MMHPGAASQLGGPASLGAGDGPCADASLPQVAWVVGGDAPSEPACSKRELTELLLGTPGAAVGWSYPEFFHPAAASLSKLVNLSSFGRLVVDDVHFLQVDLPKRHSTAHWGYGSEVMVSEVSGLVNTLLDYQAGTHYPSNDACSDHYDLCLLVVPAGCCAYCASELIDGRGKLYPNPLAKYDAAGRFVPDGRCTDAWGYDPLHPQVERPATPPISHPIHTRPNTIQTLFAPYVHPIHTRVAPCSHHIRTLLTSESHPIRTLFASFASFSLPIHTLFALYSHPSHPVHTTIPWPTARRYDPLRRGEFHANAGHPWTVYRTEYGCAQLNHEEVRPRALG